MKTVQSCTNALLYHALIYPVPVGIYFRCNERECEGCSGLRTLFVRVPGGGGYKKKLILT